MQKFVFLFASLCFFQVALFSQTELHSSMLPAAEVPQVGRFNPALLPEKGIVLLLPEVYFELNGSTTYDDLLRKNASGKTVLDFGNAIKNLAPTNNSLTAATAFQTLGLTWSVQKNVTISLDHALRSHTTVLYPKAAADIFWNGNAAYVGKTADLGINLQSTTFHEFGLAAAWRIHEKLRVGARAKYLNGVADVSTQRSEATLFTSDDVYQLTLKTDYAINTSNYFDYKNIDSFNFKVRSPFRPTDFFTPNRGVAFDLGVAFQAHRKLRLAASVTDLAGAIRWTKNQHNYASKGTFTYEGLDLAQVVRADSVNFGNSLDTLAKIFDFRETNAAYSSSLPTRFFISAQYEPSERWAFTALAHFQTHRGQLKKAFAAGANWKALPALRLGASYAWHDDNQHSLGASVVLKVWKFRIFALTDNVLALFQPYNNLFANGRIGLNFIIR